MCNGRAHSQVVGPFVNVSTNTSFLFSLDSYTLVWAFHRFGARVQAWNVMGWVEAQSDGVMIVPVTNGTGKVCIALQCE